MGYFGLAYLVSKLGNDGLADALNQVSEGPSSSIFIPRLPALVKTDLTAPKIKS
jgi:hypothetical protein